MFWQKTPVKVEYFMNFYVLVHFSTFTKCLMRTKVSFVHFSVDILVTILLSYFNPRGMLKLLKPVQYSQKHKTKKIKTKNIKS